MYLFWCQTIHYQHALGDAKFFFGFIAEITKKFHNLNINQTDSPSLYFVWSELLSLRIFTFFLVFWLHKYHWKKISTIPSNNKAEEIPVSIPLSNITGKRFTRHTKQKYWLRFTLNNRISLLVKTSTIVVYKVYCFASALNMFENFPWNTNLYITTGYFSLNCASTADVLVLD